MYNKPVKEEVYNPINQGISSISHRAHHTLNANKHKYIQ